MERARFIVGSICAGIAISIGCMAYLISSSAWTFPIGLFIVCSFGLNLFTGKVCFSKLKDIPSLIVCLVFNIITAFGMGYLIGFCRPSLVFDAGNLVVIKYTRGFVWLIPYAILCNALIYVAVESYRSEILSMVARLFGLYFATAIFVICGFEHCVANAFYFGLARDLSVKSVSFLGLNALFNAVGGVISYRTVMFINGNGDRYEIKKRLCNK